MKYFKDGTKKNMRKFYIAVAVCLVAVGGILVATFVNSGIETKIPEDITDITQKPTTQMTARQTSTEDQSVGGSVTGIPDERTTKTTKATTETTAPPVTEANTNPELFVFPVSNEVTKAFSDGKLVYSETMGDWRVHNGVDFKATEGQEVKALADGTISSIEEDNMWGKVVTIDHGLGIKSRYCGVNPEGIKVGDAVEVGNLLGFISGVPCEMADGPHLHLELLVDDEYVNVAETIGKKIDLEKIR